MRKAGDGPTEARLPTEAPGGGSARPVGTARTLLACVAAWVVPGAGHLLLGRRRRGLLLAVAVFGMFFGGLALDGKLYRPQAGDPLSLLATVAAAGAGVPFLAGHALGVSAGDVRSAYHDYGNTFTLVAGLLNLLVVLDAYDVAVGRR